MKKAKFIFRKNGEKYYLISRDVVSLEVRLWNSDKHEVFISYFLKVIGDKGQGSFLQLRRYRCSLASVKRIIRIVENIKVEEI